MKSFKATKKVSKVIKPANYIFEAIFSFLLSRIISEWFLLSRFESQYSLIYDFLWLKSGYIASIFMILWISDWQKTAIDLLNLSRDNNSHNASKGIIYTSQLLYFLLLIGTLIITLSHIFIISFSMEFNMASVLVEAIDSVYIFLKNNTLSFILFVNILFIKKIIKLLNYITNVCFILFMGRTWEANSLVPEDTITNLLSLSTNAEVINLIVVFILFILLKLNIYLYRYHIFENRISDWTSKKLSKEDYIHLLSIFIILIYVLLFMIGIKV